MEERDDGGDGWEEALDVIQTFGDAPTRDHHTNSRHRVRRVDAITRQFAPFGFGSVSGGAPSKMIRILIVDDAPVIRALFQRMFAASGVFEVVGTAADGQEGIRLATQLQPDVILLDLAMPIVNGFQAIPVLAERCPTSLIIVLSGLTDESSGEHALSLGAHAHIEKRHRPDEMLRRIVDIYRSKMAERSTAAPAAPPPPTSRSSAPTFPPPAGVREPDTEPASHRRRATDDQRGAPADAEHAPTTDTAQRAEPPEAEPLSVQRIRDEPRLIEPQRMEPVRIEALRVEPMGNEPSSVQPSRAEASRAEPSRSSATRRDGRDGLPRRVAVGPPPATPRPPAQPAREPQRASLPAAEAAAPTAEDMRSSLQVVVGFGELLSTAYADRIDPEGREMIDAIVSNAHRLEEMVDALVHHGLLEELTTDIEGAEETATLAVLERPLDILLVEDEPDHVKLVNALLRRVPNPAPRLHRVTSVAEARQLLAATEVDCVLLDLSLPDASDLDALAQVRSAAPMTAVVVITSVADEDLAFASVSHGAQDYLVKGHMDSEQLNRAIRWAVQRKALENELTRDALHDPLTRLPNRTLMLDRLASALARSERSGRKVVVFFMDFDGFKLINDRFGHEAGDQFLVVMGERLREAVRPQDTVARIGGDEFVIICEGFVGHESEWMPLQERLAEAVSLPMEISGHSVRVTASIGMAVGGREYDPDSMLRDADLAMYAMKRSR